MTRCEWIVCEPTSRWAAALRSAIARQEGTPLTELRLYEVRQLTDLSDRLAIQPASLVAVEVDSANLADVLTWLSSTARTYPQARCMALRGSEVVDHDLCEALAEANVLEFVDSPRRLQAAIELARRYLAALQLTTPAEDQRPLADRIWQSLPWQDDRRQVG